MCAAPCRAIGLCRAYQTKISWQVRGHTQIAMCSTTIAIILIITVSAGFMATVELLMLVMATAAASSRYLCTTTQMCHANIYTKNHYSHHRHPIQLRSHSSLRRDQCQEPSQSTLPACAACQYTCARSEKLLHSSSQCIQRRPEASKQDQCRCRGLAPDQCCCRPHSQGRPHILWVGHRVKGPAGHPRHRLAEFETIVYAIMSYSAIYPHV